MALNIKKYYSLKNILEYNASYNLIVGKRSNGKSYACLYKGLERYFNEGKQIAYIRRWRDDITGANGHTLFDMFVHNGKGENVIEKLSNGLYNNVYCYSGRYYMVKEDPSGKQIKQDKPFCYAFSINSSEHYKSNSYPFIGTIIFDEFIPMQGIGLPDEFSLFMNLLSTIIRDPSRTDILLFMVANTVNWDSPYFAEFGINNVRNMKQGTIDYYVYGNSPCSLAIEYCEDNRDKESKKNDRFFAFDSPTLKMITEGTWEMSIYPHCPCYYGNKNVIYRYFIQYNDDLIQADIVLVDDLYFTYFHFKTSEIKDINKDLIFTNKETSPRWNIRNNMLKPPDDLGRNINKFFADGQVFYQDNVVGQIISNYREWCKTV